MNNIYITTQKLRELGIDNKSIKSINTVLKVINDGVISHNNKIMVVIAPNLIDKIKNMSDIERGLNDIPINHMIEHMKEFHEFGHEILGVFMAEVYRFIEYSDCGSKRALINHFNLESKVAFELMVYIYKHGMIDSNGMSLLKPKLVKTKLSQIEPQHKVLIDGDFDNELALPFMFKLCCFLLDHEQKISFSKLYMIKSIGYFPKDVNHVKLIYFLLDKNMITQKYSQFIVTDSNVITICNYIGSTNNEK